MSATEITYAPGQKVHQFELAGLGKAPYRFEGVEQRVYCACPGAPIQPGTCCDYCGTGIMFAYWLRSADGRRFKVGCDCVLKTDSDRALRVAVMTEKQKHDRELRDARAAVKRQKDLVRIDAARARLADVADQLRAMPHPQATINPGYFGNKTRLDWAEWMFKNAGWTGRLTVAKFIEQLT